MSYRFTSIKDGQPVKYATNIIYKQRCCDCGLVHAVVYRIVNGMVEETVYRDGWETKQQRRKKHVKPMAT